MSRTTSAVLAAPCLAFAGTAAALEPHIDWADSYSVDGRCYCDTTFDHGADALEIDTPQGPKGVVEVCALIGPGPGADGHPRYNDLQCGHGPPNSAPLDDERICPGRVDMGEAGCDLLGPPWDLESLFPGPADAAGAADTAFAPPPAGIEPAEADAALFGGAPPAGALVVEAEAADVADASWTLLADGTSSPWGEGGPANPDDPDADHRAGASAGAYLELLPDAQRADDEPAPPDGVWTEPGTGPRLSWILDFPTAGTWTVRARLHPTDGRDTTLYVGLDGAFDATSGLIEACPERDAWRWSGCDGSEVAVLEVPSAGVHTLEIAGRDDGVELDRVALVPPAADAQAVGGPSVAPVPTVPAPIAPAVEPGGDATVPAAPPAPVGTPDPVEVDASGGVPASPELGSAVAVGGGLAPGVAAFGTASALPLVALAALRLWAHRRRPPSHRRPRAEG